MKSIKYLFFGITLVCAVWTGGWFTYQKQVKTTIKKIRKKIQATGGEFEAFSYTISGFPFSYVVHFDNIMIKETAISHSLIQQCLATYPSDIQEPLMQLVKGSRLQTKDLKVTRHILSPQTISLTAPHIDLTFDLLDIDPWLIQFDKIDASVHREHLSSVSLGSYQSEYNILSLSGAGIHLNMDDHPFPFQSDSMELTISPLDEDGYMQLLFGQSYLTDNEVYSCKDTKLIFDHFYPSAPLFQIGCASLTTTHNLIEDNERLTRTQVTTIENGELILTDQANQTERRAMELLEVVANVSCLAEKKDLLKDQDWMTQVQRWKELAKAQLRKGQQNIPELKTFFQEVESAQLQCDIKAKLLCQEEESFAAINMQLKNLMPEGKLSLQLAKVFFPYLSDSLFPQEVLNALDVFAIDVELKNRVFMISGLPVNSLTLIDWENLPILTEEVCIKVLHMTPEEYQDAIAQSQDLYSFSIE